MKKEERGLKDEEGEFGEMFKERIEKLEKQAS